MVSTKTTAAANGVKMISRTELEHYVNNLLQCNTIKDYCPNGLQVEGKTEIKTIITGVTACQKLLDAAVEKNADAIFVHHGYFWKGEAYPIIGIKKKRLATLLNHDISLFGYHLPLDLHATLGNNAQLAKRLGIKNTISFDTGTSPSYGIIGDLSSPLSAQKFSMHVGKVLDREPLLIQANDQNIQRIAICTGGAQDFVEHAALAGADLYLSGEISERTTHSALENNIHYIAAGHHATERYGIQTLGEHLAEKFDLEHEFIDIDNPA